ncbi:MAG: recombination mediator protein UvsY [Candidatus Levybacteria bacterium]|nr:recombination mediator protein UvsY [Candidatus Levybacteria bacterium]
MKSNDIIESWEIDSDIRAEDIGGESLKTLQLHSKYMRIYNNEASFLKKYKADYKKLYRLKWSYYLGYMDKEELETLTWEPFQYKILKQDIAIYLDGDEELSDTLMKSELQEEKVKILDQIIRMINNRNFTIKNHIDWKKFESGIN